MAGITARHCLTFECEDYVKNLTLALKLLQFAQIEAVVF